MFYIRYCTLLACIMQRVVIILRMELKKGLLSRVQSLREADSVLLEDTSNVTSWLLQAASRGSKLDAGGGGCRRSIACHGHYVTF